MRKLKFWVNGDYEVLADHDETLENVVKDVLEATNTFGTPDKYYVTGGARDSRHIFPMTMKVCDLPGDGTFLVIPKFVGCYTPRFPDRELKQGEKDIAAFFAHLAASKLDYSFASRPHTFDELEKNKKVIEDAILRVLKQTNNEVPFGTCSQCGTQNTPITGSYKEPDGSEYSVCWVCDPR